MNLSPEQVIAAFSALSAVILYLWKITRSHHRETKKDLKDCKQAHERTTEQLMDMNGRIGQLEGEQEGFKTGVELVVNKVIEEVRSLKD